MLIIVEIILTVWAWRKGWGWWSLIPPGVAIAVMVFIEVGIIIGGGSVESARGIGIVFDFLAIIALAAMIAMKSEPEKN